MAEEQGIGDLSTAQVGNSHHHRFCLFTKIQPIKQLIEHFVRSQLPPPAVLANLFRAVAGISVPRDLTIQFPLSTASSRIWVAKIEPAIFPSSGFNLRQQVLTYVHSDSTDIVNWREIFLSNS
jgi:hypothetical protein